MDLGKIKEIIMREVAVVVSIAVVMVSSIVSVAWYYIHKDASMKTNIESAIAKGIDPVAVRCAYMAQSDIMCAVYASTHSTEKPTYSSKSR